LSYIVILIDKHLLLLSTGMILLMELLQLLLTDMGIDLGSGNIRMTQELLN
jgi:hypothetical protein